MRTPKFDGQKAGKILTNCFKIAEERRIDQIRRLAYCKWHKAGRPSDQDQKFWFAAEEQYNDEIVKRMIWWGE